MTRLLLILCSRHAHEQNVLVRRAQWGQARVPFPERKRKRTWRGRFWNNAELEGRRKDNLVTLAKRG